jgi:tetratricopeptide (TPR) repeat protein
VQDYHLRVQALLQAKEYPLATEALTEALRRWPDDPRCLRNLAVIRTMEGKTEEAKRLANRLCQMPAHAAVGWAMLGTIYHRMHMSALTVECHLEALRLDPELQSVPEPIDFLKALALSLYETGQPEDSERFYLRALELQPEAETLRALGLLRSEAGDSDGAGRYWHQALELNPRYVPALTDLGALALSQGKVAEALEFYGRAVDYDPSSSTAHYGLGLAHERAGNTELAKIHCAKAEELR